MRGADTVILLVKLWRDLPLRVFAERHSIGISPDSGLEMYFSASFHFELRANPSGDKHSQTQPVLACSAALWNTLNCENQAVSASEEAKASSQTGKQFEML